MKFYRSTITFWEFEHGIQHSDRLCTIRIDFKFRNDVWIDWASARKKNQLKSVPILSFFICLLSYVPSVIDERNACVLFVEGKAIFDSNSMCSIWLCKFRCNSIFSSINRFTNASLILQEFQNNNGVFIAIESCLTASNHIKFIIRQFECSMNSNCQLNGSLFGALKIKMKPNKISIEFVLIAWVG